MRFIGAGLVECAGTPARGAITMTAMIWKMLFSVGVLEMCGFVS
jgi:hypothetical protein